FDPDAAAAQVSTRPIDGGREWTGHLNAELRACTADPEAVRSSLAPDTIRQHCRREFSRERCYEYMRQIGLDYGPLFQGIDRVWQGDREALGRIGLPEALVGEADNYVFHPALL